MTYDTGVVDYGTVTNYSDQSTYEYVVFMEGFHYETAPEIAYYEVPSGGYNRFALQSYFEDPPDEGSAEMYSTDFRIEQNDAEFYFNAFEPTNSDDDAYGSYYIAASVGPISTGAAELDLVGLDVEFDEDDFNYADWYVRLDDKDIPNSQSDTTPGARFNINVNQGVNWEQWKDIRFKGTGTYTWVDYSQDSMPRVPESTPEVDALTDFQVDAPDGSE